LLGRNLDQVFGGWWLGRVYGVRPSRISRKRRCSGKR
jgi:hypothetical protein